MKEGKASLGLPGADSGLHFLFQQNYLVGMMEYQRYSIYKWGILYGERNDKLWLPDFLRWHNSSISSLLNSCVLKENNFKVLVNHQI